MMTALRIFGFILISQAAGFIGAIATSNSVNTWYKDLIKPSFNPPSWIFGPVWTALYTCMGVASYLIWKEKGFGFPLYLFFIHLALNALWSIFFFGLKNPLLALFDIVLLWIMILALIIIFWRINKAAGTLMIPYILWVSFAMIFNFYLWRLN